MGDTRENKTEPFEGTTQTELEDHPTGGQVAPESPTREPPGPRARVNPNRGVSRGSLPHRQPPVAPTCPFGHSVVLSNRLSIISLKFRVIHVFSRCYTKAVYSVGLVISSGFTHLSKSSPLMPIATAASRSVVAFACACFAILAAISYPT